MREQHVYAVLTVILPDICADEFFVPLILPDTAHS
jgi:hypothetical protein